VSYCAEARGFFEPGNGVIWELLISAVIRTAGVAALAIDAVAPMSNSAGSKEMDSEGEKVWCKREASPDAIVFMAVPANLEE
jgi:hypothetical protein